MNRIVKILESETIHPNDDDYISEDEKRIVSKRRVMINWERVDFIEELSKNGLNCLVRIGGKKINIKIPFDEAVHEFRKCNYGE